MKTVEDVHLPTFKNFSVANGVELINLHMFLIRFQRF